MYDEGNATISAAKAAVDRPNELERLLNTQAETRELVRMITARLEVVSHPQPQEAAQGLRDSVPHISGAVDTQRSINSDLRYILDTLVV